jgi:GDP-4-dehydro-6-deoxy-D-mannose reductase
MNKALVTGENGFVGQYLVRYLTEKGWDVMGLGTTDIRNYEHLRNGLDKYRPTHIFHLAAQAYVPESFLNPKRTFEVNTIGSLNLLEAVRQLGIKSKILLAGTSEEYGSGDVTEESRPQPLSPYAISKNAMDLLGQLYTKSYGMHVVITRAFNHTGPGRGEMYAESSFAKQIVEIEQGEREVLEHGNLTSIRNYTHVRDIVRAYTLAINLPSDVYNICSSNNLSMREVVDKLVELSEFPIRTMESPTLYRPSDFSFKPPSCQKFKKLANWEPEISIDQTLEDLLDYYRSQYENT